MFVIGVVGGEAAAVRRTASHRGACRPDGVIARPVRKLVVAISQQETSTILYLVSLNRSLGDCHTQSAQYFRRKYRVRNDTPCGRVSGDRRSPLRRMVSPLQTIILFSKTAKFYSQKQ